MTTLIEKIEELKENNYDNQSVVIGLDFALTLINEAVEEGIRRYPNHKEKFIKIIGKPSSEAGKKVSDG